MLRRRPHVSVPFHSASAASCRLLLLLACSILLPNTFPTTTVVVAERLPIGSLPRWVQTIARPFLPQPPRPNLGHGSIQVIGVGFSESGGSLASALEHLGYRSFGFWEAFFCFASPGGSNDNDETTKNTRIDWDDFLEHHNQTRLIQNITDRGFDAVVGFPGCLLYEELLHSYPNAKIIFSMHRGPSRDTTTTTAALSNEAAASVSASSSLSSLRWADDALSTVLRIVELSYRPPLASFSRFNQLRNVFERWIFRMIGLPVVKSNKGKLLVLPSREVLAEVYEEWLETVQRTVPPDRLLMHDAAQDGWRPLCQFLLPIIDDTIAEHRCKTLMLGHGKQSLLSTNGELTKFVTVVAGMTMVANAYGRLPLLVLLLVSFCNGVLIFTTRRQRHPRRQETKEKSE